MIRPRAGRYVFHNGEPFELLYRKEQSTAGEIWRVKPIFTATADAPESDRIILYSDRLTPIHGTH